MLRQFEPRNLSYYEIAATVGEFAARARKDWDRGERRLPECAELEQIAATLRTCEVQGTPMPRTQANVEQLCACVARGTEPTYTVGPLLSGKASPEQVQRLCEVFFAEFPYLDPIRAAEDVIAGRAPDDRALEQQARNALA